jgi:hypothetical protein
VSRAADRRLSATPAWPPLEALLWAYRREPVRITARLLGADPKTEVDS